MEGLEVFAGAFVAQFDASVMAEPSQTTLHHPTENTQAAAVVRSDSRQ